MTLLLIDKKFKNFQENDEYWSNLFKNTDLLFDNLNEDQQFQIDLSTIFKSLWYWQMNLLSSFKIQINSFTLSNSQYFKLMNDEILKKIHHFDDHPGLDLIERRLQLIDYLTEDEKTELFRNDKNELLKLNLVLLNDVLNIRLIEKFFHIESITAKETRIDFLNLNSILRTYSKFTKKQIYFLNPHSLKNLNAQFFNQIIKSLPDDYFDSFINIKKLNRFFDLSNVEHKFKLIQNYLPKTITTTELINLLSIEMKQKNFDELIKLFFSTFDLNQNVYEYLFKFLEYLPKNEESIKNFIKKSMFLPDPQDDELIKLYLKKESIGKSSSTNMIKKNLSLLEIILKCDQKLIKEFIKKHPYADKVTLDDVTLIIQYLLDQNVSLKQIKNCQLIVLYSLKLIDEKLNQLKQDEIYDRIKDQDNFLEYLLYYIEKESSFTGKSAFLYKEFSSDLEIDNQSC